MDLTNLTAETAEMPRTARGRTATPVPANILDDVKATYNDAARAYVIPMGDKDVTDTKSDENVKNLVGVLRRAATSHGLGIAFGYERPNKGNARVIFQAKDKSERQRATKPVDIFVDEDGNEADEDSGRLATISEAKALGYVYDYENQMWTSEDGAE